MPLASSARIAVIREHRLRPARTAGIASMSATSSLRSRRIGRPARPDQLTAASIRPARCRPGDTHGACSCASAGCPGRSDCSARPQPASRSAAADACPWPTPALLPRRHLGLVGLPLRCRPACACASRRRRAASSLSRKASRRAISFGNAWGSSSPPRPPPPPPPPGSATPRSRLPVGRSTARALGHRAMLAGVGLELGAVDAHQAYAQQLQLLGQKKNLQEALRRAASSPAGSARSCRSG